MADKDHLELLSVGLKKTQCLEYLDFQLSNLNSTHGRTVCSIIKEQFEMKDTMSWRLGLRNSEHINIQKLGLKSINLARNAFTDDFCKELMDTM